MFFFIVHCFIDLIKYWWLGDLIQKHGGCRRQSPWWWWDGWVCVKNVGGRGAFEKYVTNIEYQWLLLVKTIDNKIDMDQFYNISLNELKGIMHNHTKHVANEWKWGKLGY